MQEIAALAGVIGALAVGTLSPGPSFVMVARLAVATSRAHGLSAALGMGVGGVAFAAAALLGLQAVLLAVPSVLLGTQSARRLVSRLLGFSHLSSSQGISCSRSSWSEHCHLAVSLFWLGLTTQISNPKTAIVYASVFAAFLPGTYSSSFAAVLLFVVFVIEAGWYAIVATMLSSSRPRRAYLSYKAWVDRAAGLVMVGLGLKLVASAHKA